MEPYLLKCYVKVEKYVVTKLVLFFQWYKKHICCNTLGLFLLIILYCNFFAILAEIATPIRCKMWEGKELEVFITPEEWRKINNTTESLKGVRWPFYSINENGEETDPVFIKNKGIYKQFMYFDNNKHFLVSVNERYPNLNVYGYINPDKSFGHDTFVLYDQFLKKVIAKYHSIVGYSISHLSGLAISVSCENEQNPYDILESYLN